MRGENLLGRAANVWLWALVACNLAKIVLVLTLGHRITVLELYLLGAFNSAFVLMGAGFLLKNSKTGLWIIYLSVGFDLCSLALWTALMVLASVPLHGFYGAPTVWAFLCAAVLRGGMTWILTHRNGKLLNN